MIKTKKFIRYSRLKELQSQFDNTTCKKEKVIYQNKLQYTRDRFIPVYDVNFKSKGISIEEEDN